MTRLSALSCLQDGVNELMGRRSLQDSLTAIRIKINISPTRGHVFGRSRENKLRAVKFEKKTK